MSVATKRSNVLIPALVGLLFLGPLALATFMYYFGGDRWRPAGSIAHGILIRDPHTLPTGPVVLSVGGTAKFLGKWSLLYVGRGTCDAKCRESLYQTRQVRRALGKEMSRVQRIFVSSEGQPEAGFLGAEHPDLIVLGDSMTTRDIVLPAVGPFKEGDVFVADPLGNVIMRFPAGTPMKDMHKDLSLLLKASQIG